MFCLYNSKLSAMLATTVKLLGNMIILTSIQAYGEAYALSDAIGFEPSVFHEVIRESTNHLGAYDILPNSSSV